MNKLYVVIYSHLGNTGRFARNQLIPVLRDSELAATRDIEEFTLHAVGPHQPLQAPASVPALSRIYEDETEFLLVFPCYGRNNPFTGELEDMVPLPVRQFIERVEGERLGTILGGVVCGNRTFGHHFAYADREFDFPIFGKVELAGSRTDAINVVSTMEHPAHSLT